MELTFILLLNVIIIANVITDDKSEENGCFTDTVQVIHWVSFSGSLFCISSYMF